MLKVDECRKVSTGSRERVAHNVGGLDIAMAKACLVQLDQLLLHVDKPLGHLRVVEDGRGDIIHRNVGRRRR